MPNWWNIDGLEAEMPLVDWRWLCPQKLDLLARNALGDLFLRDEQGCVFLLDVSIGDSSKIAESEARFVELAHTEEKSEEWFLKSDERLYATRDWHPSRTSALDLECRLSLKKADPIRRMWPISMNT